MANSNLREARRAKRDEFYTQWADIEREMNAYLEYHPDVFQGKTILLPCDDPEWSNFTKYFALHFMDFGIKKLISTSYAPASNHGGMFYEPQLFETKSPIYDTDKSRLQGRVFTLVPEDFSGDGKINLDDLQWEYLEGDGDFHSLEVTSLRDEADMVVTNPPFSLFRNFLAWLVEGEVRFSVIGNMNANTYKEVFPLVSDNQIWKGATANNTDMVFQVPEGTEIRSSDREKAERMGYVGNFTRLGNSCWFTNIEHGRRHEPLQLMTMEDNLKYNKKIAEVGYPKYDNYDAIEVGRVDAIPSDYDGVMGVPISFLDKYNPDQFEVLGITQSWDDISGLKLKSYPTQTQVSKTGSRSQVGKLNDGAAIRVDSPPDATHYEVDGELFVKPYCRILIRARR
jgi:hypothetical protein